MFLIFTCLTYSQTDSLKITFEITTKNLSVDEKVCVSGNKLQLGNWDAGRAPLSKLNDSLWAISLFFGRDESIEFKFTKGSWNKEAINDDGSIPQNYSLLVQRDTTLKFRINKWRDEIEERIQGQITGNVVYHRNFTYEKLLPRDIIVWLPPDYYTNEQRRYPVLYMHDGQNIFDPATSSFGIDWQMDETADSLIRNNEIEPLIIVGINNTANRTPEYTYGDTGKAYMEFVVNKIKPFIDENYRTMPGRRNTFTAGSSLGGLISFMLAWEYPEVFFGATCFSPAFKIKELDYVQFVTQYKGPKKLIKFYIDNGGVGLETELQPGIDDMLVALKGKEYVEGKDYCWVKDSSAQHTESAWARRAWKPLKLFFGNDFFEDGLIILPPDEWRFRVMGGASFQMSDEEFFSHLSLNSRYSPFASESSVLRLQIIMEHGLNLGLNPEGFPWFLYYGKAGPELRLFDNYFLDVHFGLCGGLIYGGGGFIFYGAETGYILPVADNFSLEFEFGINGLLSTGFLYYFIAGISL